MKVADSDSHDVHLRRRRILQDADLALFLEDTLLIESPVVVVKFDRAAGRVCGANCLALCKVFDKRLNPLFAAGRICLDEFASYAKQRPAAERK
jgi:hypothetical protein